MSHLEGLLALVGLQFLAAQVSTRWVAARRLLRSEPVLLLPDGRLLDDVPRRAVVLETDGSFLCMRGHGLRLAVGEAPQT